MEIFSQTVQVGNYAAMAAAIGLAVIMAAKAVEAVFKGAGRTVSGAALGWNGLKNTLADHKRKRIANRALAVEMAERRKAAALVETTKKCAEGLEAAHAHVAALARGENPANTCGNGRKRFCYFSQKENDPIFATLKDGTTVFVLGAELKGPDVIGYTIILPDQKRKYVAPAEITFC